jgi:thiamine pyrophosphate-dependent acetolactate synthase large subunit-like protein
MAAANQAHDPMNNADLIVATLKAAGIDRGFGIPSGNVLPLMEAMRKGRGRFRPHRP